MAKPKVKRPATTGRTVLDIPIEQILLDPHQPRKEFVLEYIAELALSIKTNGLLQFPTVNRAFERDGMQYYYIKAGERRYHAHNVLSRATMTCVVLSEPYVGKKNVERILSQAAENSSRVPHTHSEIVAVYELVLEEEKALAKERKGSEHGAIETAKRRLAEAFGKSVFWATNYHTLLSLEPELRPALDMDGEGKLPFTTGLVLSRAPKSDQKALWQQAEGVRSRRGQKAANDFVVRQANIFRQAHSEATGQKVRIRSLRTDGEVMAGLVRRSYHAAEQLVGEQHSTEFLQGLQHVIGAMDAVDVDEMLGQLQFSLVTFGQVRDELKKRRAVLYEQFSVKKSA